MLPVGRFTTFGVPFQSPRVGVHPHHHTPLPVHIPVHMHAPFIIPHHGGGGAAAHPHHHRGWKSAGTIIIDTKYYNGRTRAMCQTILLCLNKHTGVWELPYGKESHSDTCPADNAHPFLNGTKSYTC